MKLATPLVLLASLLVGIASCHRLNSDDARHALETAEAAATTEDAARRAGLYYTGCGEAPSCAAGCAKGLKLCGDREVDDAQRSRILAQCYPAYATAHKANPKLAPTPWFAGYFSAYLKKARAQLDGGDQARLDAATKKLGLP